MSQPEYVQTLSSGAGPTDNPLTLHPLIAEDLDRQTREMEQARARAAVSCHDYLLDGTQSWRSLENGMARASIGAAAAAIRAPPTRTCAVG